MRPIPVATFQGIDIFCQPSAKLSFFNSPWFPHRQGQAIDIYDGIFGSEVKSPVDGIIQDIRRFHSPESKYFEHLPWEWGILINPFKNDTNCFKILHVEPTVNKGDEIHVGSVIGNYIRNGYFEPWTDPHIHLEIRNKTISLNSMYRASGAIPFQSQIEPKVTQNHSEELIGQVNQINPHFLSVQIEDCNTKPGWKGITAKVGKNIGLIDCGLAYYNGFGGIVGKLQNAVPNTPIFIGNRVIGHITHILDSRRALAKFIDVKISVNDRKVLGLSLDIAFEVNQLKIVDRNLNQFGLEEGDNITIKIM